MIEKFLNRIIFIESFIRRYKNGARRVYCIFIIQFTLSDYYLALSITGFYYNKCRAIFCQNVYSRNIFSQSHIYFESYLVIKIFHRNVFFQTHINLESCWKNILLEFILMEPYYIHFKNKL